MNNGASNTTIASDADNLVMPTHVTGATWERLRRGLIS